MNTRPLDGIRVVELATMVAGPTAGKALKDWGAEVIKIENLGGDLWRYFGAPLTCPVTEDENPIFDCENGGKDMISINNKSEEGKELTYKLLETADVFITNVREDGLKKLGLSYDQLKEKFPSLVYGHLIGYGTKGEMSNTASYDITAFWARTGLMSSMTDESGEPIVAGISSFGDHTAGIYLAAGVCAALVRKMKSGVGEKVNASLYHAGLFNMGTMITASQYSYEEMINALPKHSASNTVYKTSDNKYIMLTVPDIDKFYKNMCIAINRPDLMDDTRFNTRDNFFKPENTDAFYYIYKDALVQRTAAEWTKIFGELSIPVQEVYSFKEVSQDSEALVNDFFHEVEFKSGKKVNIAVTPVQFEQSEAIPYEKAKALGSDTVEIMKSLGYSEEQISELEKNRVVRAK